MVGRAGIRTYVARLWVAGKGLKRRVRIGVAGAVRPDRHTWTVVLARTRAKELIADAAKGIDRNAQKREDEVAHDGAIILRQGMELHLSEMRDNGKRDVSIKTLAYDVPRLLAEELDRPLAELTVEAVQKIKERGREHKTQTNRLLAHLSAIWNSTLRLRRSTFGGANPALCEGDSRLGRTA